VLPTEETDKAVHICGKDEMGSIVKFGGAPVWVEGEVLFRCPSPALDVVITDIDLGTGIYKLTQWIGAFCVLDGTGGLSLGDHSVVSSGVQIYSHVNDLPLKGPDRSVTRRKTTIGSHVYLGPNVVVTAGVTIGDGAVVGAGAYVDKDIKAGDRLIPRHRYDLPPNVRVIDVLEERREDGQ
jgi:hypothetical protein